MLDFFLLVVGLVILVYGANMLVDSASALAKKFNIPNIVIGLTIVAFGTSAPELSVNLFAAASGQTDITLGNVIGSNIFNVLGILGISALIYPLTVKSNTTWIEIPLSLLSALVVLLLANDAFIDSEAFSVINRIDGLILLCFFVIFLAYNAQLVKKSGYEEELETKDYSTPKATLFILLGLAMLVAGGRLIVTSATDLARLAGISERIIALTIISIGTSLPELATSVIAARKRNVDIAIGNVVGSNIFNIFLVLGASAVINPVTIQQSSNADLFFNLAVSFLLFVFMFTGKARSLSRPEGGMFVIFYIAYIMAIIFWL